jgi:F-type H+-transporting ATPase subunit b
MDSFIETFHIDWKIMIAQAVNFGVVLVVFYLFALKPLKKVMSERSARIEKGLVDAKRHSEILALTQKEADEITSKARLEAHEIFQSGKNDAEEKKADMIRIAQEEVNRMVEQGKKSLEAEKNKMMEEVKKEVVYLVVRATEKLLEDEVDSSFVDKQLKKIEKA